jgi:pentatricopeptide repeat protein
MRTSNKPLIETIHRKMALQKGWDINCYVYLIHAHAKLGNSRAVIRLFEEMTNGQFQSKMTVIGTCVALADVCKAMQCFPAKRNQLIAMSSFLIQNWKDIHPIVTAWWKENGWIEGVHFEDPVRLKLLQKAGLSSVLDAISMDRNNVHFQIWIDFIFRFEAIRNHVDLYLFSELIRHGATMLSVDKYLSILKRYKVQRMEYITKQNEKSQIPFSVAEMTNALIHGDQSVRNIRDWNLPVIPRKELSYVMYLLGKERSISEIEGIWNHEINELLPFLWSRIMHSVRLDILNAKEKLQAKLDSSKRQKNLDRGKLKEEMTYLNKQLKKGIAVQVGEQGPLAIVYSGLIDGWRAGQKNEGEHVLELEKLLQRLQAKETAILEDKMKMKGGRLLFGMMD